MKPLRRQLLTLLLLSLLLPAGGVVAQWNVVAPHLIRSTEPDWKGAMCFRDGVLWLARDVLLRSMDSGLTWMRVLDLSTLKSGNVEDIDFFDRTRGILVDSGGSFLTQDGGKSWKKVIGAAASHSGCFGNKPSTMAVGAQISIDGGANWYSGPVPNTWVQCVRPQKDGSFVCFGSVDFYANLYRTSNAGISWVASATTIDEDSWSFAIDSCDGQRIYMSNENIARPTDDFSKLLVTTDFGTSWTRAAAFPRNFFAGSIAESRRVIFCPTVKNGVFRSIDRGVTWASTGGPNASPDTRLIAAITDNLVVVVDSGGSVWRTTNSGGQPVTLAPTGVLAIRPTSLFDFDTLRCDSLVRSIAITRSGCAPPDLLRWSLIGADAASYHADQFVADSLRIGLVPTRSGNLSASIVFAVTDGSFDTVRLGGFNASQIGTLSPDKRTLFDSDTTHCDTVIRYLRLTRAGCFPPIIDSIYFIGPDAASFATRASTPDSLAFVFLPSTSGTKKAQAVLHKSDGGADTITLKGVSTGYGSLSPTVTLFGGDTAHCDKLSRTLSFHPSGCDPPAVTRLTLTGADSASYTVGTPGKDSATITFAPSRGGAHHSSIIMALADGTADTVMLAGFNDVGSTSVLPTTLFGNDTLHCDTLTRGLKLQMAGCAPPTLRSWSFGGPDSGNYMIAQASSDSLLVAFLPRVWGGSQVPLICTMSDGTRDTVDLRGYSSDVPFTYALDRQSAFTGDSLYLCETPKVEKISASFKACHWPHIVSQSITGSAQSDYTILHPVSDPLLLSDSVVIAFLPSASGTRSASYDITFDDGTHLSLPLIGYGNAPHQLAITTATQSPTTLGDIVQVPITLTGLARTEDIELVLHYDPILPYRGSVSPSNAVLDIAGQQWKGRSKLHLTGATPNSIAGNAKFDVFNDSLRNPIVTLDSVVVLSAIGPCQYLDAPPVSATILLPAACGMPLLSRYLHYGRRPTFRINPNPSSGTVYITCASDVGDATVTIYDMLGVERGRTQVTVRAATAASISMPAGDGLYYVRLESATSVSGETVVVRR